MIRAVAAGMVYAIFQDLPFQHKKKKQSTIGHNWCGKTKKNCNTVTVLSQICDGTVAVLQI